MSRSYTSSPPKRLHGVYRDCFLLTYPTSQVFAGLSVSVYQLQLLSRGGRAALKPFKHSDRGFQTRLRHGCMSVFMCRVLYSRRFATGRYPSKKSHDSL
jgi:hypothetical protein